MRRRFSRQARNLGGARAWGVRECCGQDRRRFAVAPAPASAAWMRGAVFRAPRMGQGAQATRSERTRQRVRERRSPPQARATLLCKVSRDDTLVGLLFTLGVQSGQIRGLTRDGEGNMPACPMVTAKLKAGESAKAIEAEQMRRAHVYKNDVDLSKSYLNEVIWYRVEDNEIKPTFDEAIARRMGELKTRRKIRKDAVKALGILISCNGQLEGPEAVAYLKKCADWLAARYGRENVLQAVVHMDEGTPHLHFWFAPVIHDERTGFDRLAAKSVFSPNIYEKKNGKRVGVKEEGLNSILQREFYEQMASKYGFDKPLTWDERFQDGIEYKTHAEFKAGKRRERFEQEAAAAGEQARQAAELEQVAREQADEAMADYVKTAADAAKAEEERDALRDEVAALHGERRQAVEATKAARAAQGEAEQSAHSAREAADRAAVDLAETKAAADAETERLESVRRDREAADARVAGLRERVAAARAAAGERSPQPARQSVAEDAREVFEGRSLKAEEEQLREEVRALEQRQSALRGEVRELGRRIRELVANIETAKNRIIAKCREGIRVDRMPRNLANMLFNLLDRKRIEGRMRAGGEWASVATGVYAADISKRQQAYAEAPRWELRRERGRSR